MDVKLLDEATYAETMMTTVRPALAECRDEGWLAPSRAERLTKLRHPGLLHYVCYDADRFDTLREHGATGQFRGAVVISHGFTEFAERFEELAWYLLLDGYSVCILEHRGHGFSPHDVNDESLVWIDDWHRYVDDLAKFCSLIGKRYAKDAPLYLYGHSMGGGVAAALLQEHPTLIDKAVLSAPMIAPKTGMPLWFAPVVTETACAIGLSRHIAPTQQRFSEEFDADFHEGLSLERARWVHELRLQHVEYHTNAATFGWVNQGLRMSRALLKREACERIETPILVFQAESDRYVLLGPQDRFVRQVQEGGCPATLVRLAGSHHEMTTERNAVMEQYIGRILEFLRTPIIEE
ncbi:lysophospholipase [Bifidobacterium margollesii]|uniref:Lysophospholipase n=1 Tax=Bifidobacterium margollesii TaxID=2020964 RepID=A0A2N5JD73_9BIFI|nr:alpha/beta fold hydrolase [Bifidobacterium margollesii]PLS32135.1 lysophospholipase [Bifidobacterium margollesii]